ncbi:MAG TPA: type 4a pilus biogenesis protein PilO [Acidimicrobiia bacterium]|nr:type 4a pilus biogenesis protein PilO [Acidimicrobiia bacterium]
MRRAFLLGFLAAVLVTVAWWLFIIGPRNARISDLEREHLAAVDTEQRLRVQITQLEDIRDRDIEYLAAVGQLNSLIPDRPLLEDFIEQVHALALSTGVDLQTLAPSPPEVVSDESVLRQISVSVQIEGRFFEVLGFLFGLTDMERLVRVDAVSLASSQEEGEGTVLSVGIELKLFTIGELIPIVPDGGADTTTTTVTEGTGT